MTDQLPVSPIVPPTKAVPKPSFWRRRLLDPIVAQLTQGVTADKIAFTLGLGTGLSLFPFIGLTSLLNFAVGVWLKLNQPMLQTLNQLLTPVHLVMILVYLRLGEKLWGAEPMPFSVPTLLKTARDESVGEFLNRFGWVGVHAFSAWLLTLPLVVLAIEFALRPVLRNAAARIQLTRDAATPAP